MCFSIIIALLVTCYLGYNNFSNSFLIGLGILFVASMVGLFAVEIKETKKRLKDENKEE